MIIRGSLPVETRGINLTPLGVAEDVEVLCIGMPLMNHLYLSVSADSQRHRGDQALAGTHTIAGLPL